MKERLAAVSVESLIGVLLLSVPLFVKADVRFELRAPNGGGAGGSIVHAPYDQNDADLEIKFNPGSDKIIPVQLANGTYNVEYSTVFKNVKRLSVRTFDLAEADTGGTDKTTVTCNQTAGVFVDDQGNTFTSNDCLVLWKVGRTSKRNRYTVHLEMVLRGAARAAAEAAVMEGTSKAFR